MVKEVSAMFVDTTNFLKKKANYCINPSGIGSACCNPSDWEDGIRGWHEDGSPPKEVARSLWCLHQPYGHVKPPLGDDMALGVEQGP